MAFTKSTVATNNISALANKPLESAPTLKQKFDQYGIDDKARFNLIVDELEATTGTSGAENIGSKTISGVTGNTVHAQITDLKAQQGTLDNNNVKLTGNQTVAGTKTFQSSPVVPVASADIQAPQKKYVDDENLKDVHLTGDQTIAGIKTFNSSPIVPPPSTAMQASNKGYIDAVAENFTLGAIPDASITYDKQNAESKLTVEKQSFKNKIINGNFDIWQRGTSQTAPNYGSDDRWANSNTGSTKLSTRQLFIVGQTEVPNNPTYYSRTVVTSVAGAGNYCFKSQRIEWVSTFSGKTITVSFYAKADAAKNIAIEINQSFGTGGSPSAIVTAIGVTTFALSSSWVKYTTTISVPSITGKTVGLNGDDYLNFIIWFEAGSTFNSRTNSLGNQSGTFDIAQVQIESGSIATIFEQRPIGVELALCKRYFERIVALDSYGITMSQASSTTQCAFILRNSVEMRTPPLTSLSNITALNSAGSIFNAITAIELNRPTTLFTNLVCKTSGLVAGNASEIAAGAGGGYVDFDAEL